MRRDKDKRSRAAPTRARARQEQPRRVWITHASVRPGTSWAPERKPKESQAFSRSLHITTRCTRQLLGGVTNERRPEDQMARGRLPGISHAGPMAPANLALSIPLRLARSRPLQSLNIRICMLIIARRRLLFQGIRATLGDRGISRESQTPQTRGRRLRAALRKHRWGDVVK